MRSHWQFMIKWGLVLLIQAWFFVGSLEAAVFPEWKPGNWGSISQGFYYDFHSITRSRFYLDGGRIYEFEPIELDDSVQNNERDGEEAIGQETIFESRTAYYYQYFTFLFIYGYEQRVTRLFNFLQIEDDEARLSRTVHTIMPQAYLTYEPVRIGISYYDEFSDTPKLPSEQPTSLRGERTLSLHSHFYIAKIPKTPIGLALLYEYGLDMAPTTDPRGSEIFQSITFNFDLHFTYYSQFKLAFARSWTTRDLPFVSTYPVPGAEEIDNGPDVDPTYELTVDNLIRYQIDYIFLYRFTQLVSVNVIVGHLLYSNFESPSFRFKVGITFHLGN